MRAVLSGRITHCTERLYRLSILDKPILIETLHPPGSIAAKNWQFRRILARVFFICECPASCFIQALRVLPLFSVYWWFRSIQSSRMVTETYAQFQVVVCTENMYSHFTPHTWWYISISITANTAVALNHKSVDSWHVIFMREASHTNFNRTRISRCQHHAKPRYPRFGLFNAANVGITGYSSSYTRGNVWQSKKLLWGTCHMMTKHIGLIFLWASLRICESLQCPSHHSELISSILGNNSWHSIEFHYNKTSSLKTYQFCKITEQNKQSINSKVTHTMIDLHLTTHVNQMCITICITWRLGDPESTAGQPPRLTTGH